MKKILIVEDDRATRYLLSRTLKTEGYAVSTATDGAQGLRQMRKQEFDLALLDVWMPRMNGLELLAKMRAEGIGTKAVVLTSDDTPETLLRAVREQAWQYISKPIEPSKVLELVSLALSASPAPPIEVLSALPEWVELLVPCDASAAERIQDFMARLETDLPEDVRDSVGLVFHEMLMNAIEWGGRFDPNRKVRISYIRTRRMVLYRIADPGQGFHFDELAHAAVSYAPEERAESAVVRHEKGIRPGGFGILMARSMVDELLYNEVHNEVLFVKYLS
ncbi:MAG TPA: response regulator [Bryobacteraceae bacterium]|jgi:CheY-like chemotaxis protein